MAKKKTVTEPREETIEARLLAHGTDAEFEVYADWLLAQGAPRGELAALQRNPAQAEAATRFIHEHREHVLGPLAPFWAARRTTSAPLTATWRHGWMRSVRLCAMRKESYEGFDTPTVGDVRTLIAQLPKVPAARLLSELIIASPMAKNWNGNFDKAVVALTAVLPALPLLRSVSFGENGPRSITYENAFQQPDPAWWDAAQQLRSLTVCGGSVALGLRSLPGLERLRVDVRSSPGAVVSEVSAHAWPALVSLDLWLSRPDLVPAMARLFAGDLVPALRHVGLRMCFDADEMVAALVKSPLARQLSSIDLFGSALTARGVRSLAEAALKLETLDVSQCALDEESARLAGSLAKLVRAADQRPGARPGQTLVS